MKKVYLSILLFILLLMPINSKALTNISYADTSCPILTVDRDTSTTTEEKEEDITKLPGHWEYVTDPMHFCEREDSAKIIRVLYLFLQIIRVAVPIILIISLAIGFTKAVANADELKKAKKSAISKIIAAVLVFLIPTFVSIITNIAGFNVTFDDCLEMAKHPKPIKKWVLDELDVEQTGIYFKVNAKKVTGYYFSNKEEKVTKNGNYWIPSTKETIDFVLLPGKHFIYARTDNGIIKKEVDVKTSDIIITNDVKDIKLLTTDLDKFLLQQGSSLKELNDAIARSVYIAGTQTKAGASASTLALTQILYIKYKIKIPYGNTHGNHLVIGAHGSWGSPNIYSIERAGKFYNQGMHCGGFVAWAYTQANFEMNPGIGSNATLCKWKYGSYVGIDSKHRGEVGDTLTYARNCEQSVHVAVMNAMDDKGYYLTEANAWTSTINGVKTLLDNIGIVTTYNTYGSRWHGYLDMNLTVQYKKNKTGLNSGF